MLKSPKQILIPPVKLTSYPCNFCLYRNSVEITRFVCFLDLKKVCEQRDLLNVLNMFARCSAV